MVVCLDEIMVRRVMIEIMKKKRVVRCAIFTVFVENIENLFSWPSVFIIVIK